MIGACVYSWLTVATTTDLALLTNAASEPLPIIGAKIPIAGFYWFAPVILLAVYLYLHLYLQRMWDGLASLPAIFPDGRALDERAYPWMLTSLIRAYMPLLMTHQPTFSKFMVFVSIFSGWWLVPFTLMLFWVRYIPRHDFWWLLWLFALLAISIWAAIIFTTRASATLRGERLDIDILPDVEAERQKPAGTATDAFFGIRLLNIGRRGIEIGTALIAAPFGYFLCYAAINYPPIDAARFMGNSGLTRVIGSLDRKRFLELFEAEISSRPQNWNSSQFREGLHKSIQKHLHGAEISSRSTVWKMAARDALRPSLDGINKVRLLRMRLEYANANYSFIAGANLRGTIISHAQFWGTTLTGSDMTETIAINADLRRANLVGVNLSNANLKNAKLSGADFSAADLRDANLQGAELNQSDLRKSNVTQSQLDQTCFRSNKLFPQPPKLPIGLEIRTCGQQSK